MSRALDELFRRFLTVTIRDPHTACMPLRVVLVVMPLLFFSPIWGQQSAKTLMLPMRDGVRLATDIYGTEGDVRRPVLLMRTPYNKNDAASIASLFTVSGYSVVVQDCRGRFGSEGEYYPYRNDADDGVDTLQWIRRQPWCDARIGMWGASHPGAVEWLTAARDDGLTAIAPVSTFTSLYDICYRGGALRLAFVAGAGIAINPPPAGRKAPEELGKQLLYLPVSELDREYGWPMPWLADILRHPASDPFWKQFDVTEALDRLTVPALHLSGYFDLFCRDVVESFRRLSANPANRGRQRLILGPWEHTSLGKAQVGLVNFGSDAALDFPLLYLDWFNRTFGEHRDAGNGNWPAVRYFSMGDNRWYTADEWPPRDAHVSPLYLHSNGNANSSRGDGRLQWQAANRDDADNVRSDPDNPVPVLAPGAPVASRAALWRPSDQRVIEERSDVLVYSTEPLGSPLRFAGPVLAELWVRANRPSADWTVKLVDVREDGFALGLAEGILRTDVGSGTLQRILVDLGHSAAEIAVRHRLRVEIAGSCFPLYDRNTHAAPGRRSVRAVVANQTVVHTQREPSRLLLPVIRTAK